MACHDNVVCPAYQSKYILDDSTRTAYFSYVWQLDEATRATYIGAASDSLSTDSTSLGGHPMETYYAYAGENNVPWRVRKRTKYGIVKYEPNWLRRYRMRTAPMENMFGPEPEKDEAVELIAQVDSLAMDSASVALGDSLTAPSAPVTKVPAKDEQRFFYGYDPNDNFNVEQEYYNKYFGEKFIDDRPLPEPAPLDSLSALPDSLQEKEPFFQRLFGGISDLFKKKDASDSLGLETIPLTDEDLPGDEPGNE